MKHPTTQATPGHPAIPGTSGPTVFVMADNEKKETSFAKKSATVLSIVQIIVGIASSFAQTVIIILLSTNFPYDHVGGIGEGIYCGVFFIIAGGLGILTSHKPTICNINAFMTLSIIASIFSGIQIILATIKLCIIDNYYEWTVSDLDSKMAMLSIIILAGAVEMIVAIICAAICCGACCCGSNGSSVSRVVYLAQGENGSGAVPVQMDGDVPLQMAGGVPVQMAGGIPVQMAGGVPAQMAGGVLVQMTNGISVQMAYIPQTTPVTGVLDQTLNELPSYGDVVRGDEQETKEKY